MIDTSDFDFEPNDIDSDSFLSELPLSLIKENITSQFDDPLEYRKKDHVQTFISMYRYSSENADVYEDEDKDSLEELRDDFYAFMQQIFRQYLGLGIVDFSDMSKDDQDDMIHYIYRFFLINMKKNFTCYILNYIDEHRGEFCIDDEDKRKDVTTLSLKKDVTDPEDIYILANLNEVIDSILREDITVDDFLENCDKDESCLETRFIVDKYDKYQITGNFVEKYVDMLDDDFKLELEIKIRNKILKKHKKK